VVWCGVICHNFFIVRRPSEIILFYEKDMKSTQHHTT
jgi:hypothetical protein